MFHLSVRAALFAGLTLFSAASAGDASFSRLNALRINDRLNVMVALAGKSGGAMQVWQAYDCKTLSAEALYRNLLNDRGVTTARFYGSEFGRYAPPQPGPNQDADTLKRICSLPEKAVVWEQIAPTDRFGATALIDVASLKRSGDELQVRLGYDYASSDFDPPYDAPYAFKVENYRFNCQTQTHEALSLMDVDDKGYVTDSLDGADVARRKASFPLTPLMKQTFTRLCASADLPRFHALGRFTPAARKAVSGDARAILPDLSDNPASVMAALPLDKALQQQLHQLISPWAMPRFRQLSWVENSPSGKVEVRIDVDDQGYLRKLENYGIWKVQRLTLGNLIQLKFAMSIASQPSRLETLKTTLRFPLVAGQQFEADTDLVESAQPSDARRTRQQCKVQAGGEARTINPAFSGRYLQLACRSEGDAQKPVETREAWLEDLRVLVPLASKLGSAAWQETRLEQVEIMR
ncbi:hypothetical protein BBB56_03330 [Candidatus Pantoea deserta]|uniref:DUF2066 domain-containing protein n=1 Tax=Candidatus Pantoea deserta TaxID=1869313 RepID=A0A3N4PGB7_9GAMM|nr:hypothetical protein [Pantoea deserta]RPE03537.1 hypothetical protein BBB56_03330 [Pantoea deserta]